MVVGGGAWLEEEGQGGACLETFSYTDSLINIYLKGWVQCLIPIIPATQEVEIKRIKVGGQSRQKVSENP
jgi:hypothetical protein